MSIPFRTLGLGGGGVKGLLHIGALLELSKKQDLIFSDGVYGVSVGAVIGTYLAFGLPFDDEGLSKLREQFNLNNIIQNIDFKAISLSFSMKGVVSMDSFEKLIVDLFESRGINIRDKVLSDAKMPLYIVASNLSKGKPTIFSGKVPVLDALKCSCAIPGVFIPQVLYNQLYIDGDMFCPSVDKFIPNLDHAICFSLKFRVPTKDLIPENIENMSPLTYIHSIYNMVTQNFSNQVKTDKTLDLYYEGLYSTSDISEVDIESIFKKAAHDLNRFLSTKSVLQELAE
jgi:hypothetical protein